MTSTAGVADLAGSVQLMLLGPPRVLVAGEPVRFDTRKAIALLAVIGVERRPHPREQLAALLWPGSDQGRARSALRRTLSVVGTAAGDAALTLEGGTVACGPATTTDVADFERLAAAGDTESLAAAARLHRDQFLAGFGLRDSPGFEDWQLFVADGLTQRLAQVLDRLARIHEQEGALDLAVAVTRRRLALDPLHEPAHQALIRLYTELGERGAALRQYRSCVRVLDEELAVAPLPETTALYEAVRASRPPREPRAAPAVPAASRPRLVGRDRELGVLLDAWRHVGPGGRLVTIVGADGIGKTRLVEELRARVREAGAPFIAGRGHDGEADLEFGVVTDLLRQALAPPGDVAGRMAAADLSELRRLVPVEATTTGPPDTPSPARPADGPAGAAQLTLLFQAAQAALRLAISAPGAAGVLVVEDLHWLDSASADLLGWLIRRLPKLPGLVVLTWRPARGDVVSMPPGLRSAVDEARRHGEAADVRPAPLTEAEVTQLLNGVPGAVPAEIHAETGGLPLLVTAYAEALREASSHAGMAPPPRVRELLLDQLEQVTETARQVLAAAAVLGGRAEPGLLRAASGRGEAETVDALEEALRRGLLVERAAGAGVTAHYEFPHDALRQVVAESTSLARRQLLHGRAADALARSQGAAGRAPDAAAVAAHLREAGRLAEAADWAVRAADRAAALPAHTEALAHLRDALELGWPAEDAQERIGDTLTLLGRYPEAITAFERAAAGVEGAQALAALEHKLADVQLRLGDAAASAGHLRSALELAGDDSPAAARILADLALALHRGCDDARAREVAQRALVAAAENGDGDAIVQASSVLGMIELADGHATAGEQYLRQALTRARQDGALGATVAALNNLSRTMAATGDKVEAVALAEEALTLGLRHGDLHRAAALHSNLADLLHASGLDQEAEEHLTEAARLFAEVDADGDRHPYIWTLVEW